MQNDKEVLSAPPSRPTAPPLSSSLTGVAALFETCTTTTRKSRRNMEVEISNKKQKATRK